MATKKKVAKASAGISAQTMRTRAALTSAKKSQAAMPSGKIQKTHANVTMRKGTGTVNTARKASPNSKRASALAEASLSFKKQSMGRQ